MRARAGCGLLPASMLVFAASARARGSIGTAAVVLEASAHLSGSSNPACCSRSYDPVEDGTYELDSVSVDDFALPAAWSAGAAPHDEAGQPTTPLEPGSTLGI